MITPFRQIRNGYRNVKWWFMRANKKLPPCDWWDFKYELADFIAQGLEGLLYDGVTDWDSPTHKKEKEALEFILKWAKTFPYMESAIFVRDPKDYEETLKEVGGEVMVVTEGMWKEWEKEQTKAFKLLGKYYSTLWD